MPTFPPLMRWVLWGALASAIGIYLFVLQVAGSDSSSGGDTAGLKNIFYLIGILLFGGGQVIKYFANHLRTPEGKPKLPPWIDQAFLVSLAITEAVAILGLVLGFMGAAPKEYLPLFVLSAVGMILLAPRFFFRIEELEG
ncbi:MAG: hypothetical protein P1U87_14075 [Verrucomicrobiales bacterium]|nr:hypothetical protein [Verrucomicrobiales bacterium]